MGRFPDSLGAPAKKVNDAMYQFKKCASDSSWHLYHVSNIFASVKNYLYFITSGCATLVLFRK